MKTDRVISEADVVPNRAAGYRLEEGELRNQTWVSPTLNTTADGALYFSILDLVAWDGALRAKALMKPESWALVFQPVASNSGKNYPTALAGGCARSRGAWFTTTADPGKSSRRTSSGIKTTI
jgi:hypothetical protein